MQTIIQSLKTIIIATVIGLGVAYVFAWTGPTQNPPEGNVPAPINIGPYSQYKEGALGISGVLRVDSNAIFGGKVGIGTGTPGEKLEVVGNIKGTKLCIGTDCRDAWPTGGGAGTVSGSGTLNYIPKWTGSSSVGDSRIYDTGTYVGIGTNAPKSYFSVYSPAVSAALTDFTQFLPKSGINIITKYTADAYTPGVFWSTEDNNADKPKAGIFLRETAAGTTMYFGTSNSYGTGITSSVSINPSGKIYTPNNIQADGSIIGNAGRATVYSMPVGCGGGLTNVSTCKTTLCAVCGGYATPDHNEFYSCTGSCSCSANRTSPVTCSTSFLGYLH